MTMNKEEMRRDFIDSVEEPEHLGEQGHDSRHRVAHRRSGSDETEAVNKQQGSKADLVRAMDDSPESSAPNP